MGKLYLSRILLGITLMSSQDIAIAADDLLGVRGSFSLLESVNARIPSTSIANPDNAYLKIPQRELALELRPNLKVTGGPLTLVYRPRLILSKSQAELAGSWGDPQDEIQNKTNEAFAQWQVNDTLSFTYGQQSYQWGAAEAASPSNRVFNETVQTRDFAREVPGKSIARLNYSWNQDITIVGLVEFEESDAEKNADPEQKTSFVPKGLFKPEWSWNKGADYLGLVFGGRQGHKPWLGAYANLGIAWIEGLAIYGDFSQEKGSETYYPKESFNIQADPQLPPSPVLITLEPSWADSEQYFRSSVWGLKYDFTDGSIARLEVLHYEAAYSERDRSLLRESFRSDDLGQKSRLADNLKNLAQHAADFPGQDLYYASLYLPEPLAIKDLTSTLRFIRSVRDLSYSAYLQCAYTFGQGGTAYAVAQISPASNFEDLDTFVSSTFTLALRQDW